VSAIQAVFPHGYVAVQFSADFGDDATLAVITVQLEKLAEESGFGIVLFRAGAAPWHDDLECYRRLAGERSTHVRVFSSLDVWEICALIAHSRAFCGSSLHGRIVAMAYGLPRVSLSHPHKESRTGKQAAYAATWELPGNPLTVEIDGIATGVKQALTTDPDQLLIHAQALAAKYLESFTTILALLDRQTDDPG
jgi:polysaccharide pyruvyl transferase WcaK-like protein